MILCEIFETLYEDASVDFNQLVQLPEYPPKIKRAVLRIIKQLEKRGFAMEYGNTRITMISPNKRYVIKIPRNDSGIIDSARERRSFNRQQKGDDTIPIIATCRIFYIGEIPLLMMSFVTPITDENDLPDWSGMVDCGQVGYNRHGKKVAYDL